MDPGNDILSLALKRHQARTHQERGAYSADIGLLGLSNNNNNNNNQDSSLDSSPLPTKKSYQPKGFIAEVTSAAQLRDSGRMPVPMFDEDSRGGRMVAPLVVSCQCNGRPCYALVNTTSVMSTITLSLVNKLGLERDILRELSAPQNPIADPGLPRMSVEGSVKYIELLFGGVKQVMKLFVVKDSTTDLVLGVDFLKKAHASINLVDNCLHLGGGPTPSKAYFLGTKEVQQAVKSAQQRPSTLTLF